MIRVVYRWAVVPDKFEEFRKVWTETTNRIHDSVPGAMGSFMLRDLDNQSVVLTVAKWNSFTSWKQFWGGSNPEEMKSLRKLGKRISVDAYDEIDDYTR